MQAGTTPIFNVFGMTGQSCLRYHNKLCSLHISLHSGISGLFSSQRGVILLCRDRVEILIMMVRWEKIYERRAWLYFFHFSLAKEWYV